MRVKIGHRWYNSADDNIMLVLDPEDKSLIADMTPCERTFAIASESASEADFLGWAEESKSELAEIERIYGGSLNQPETETK